MNEKNFLLSYYENATESFHIQLVTDTSKASEPHMHEYFQIYFITRGHIVHYVDEESSALLQGDMFIVPPNTVHRISSDGAAVFYSFSFMPEFLCDPLEKGSLVTSFLTELLDGKGKKILPKITLPQDEVLYIEGLIAHVWKEFQTKPIGYTETVRALSSLLVLHLARNYYETGDMTEYFRDNRQLVLHCVEYVQKNFSDKITIKDVTKRFAISQSSFCEIFFSLTGCSFHKYLNRCRIEKACEYIRCGYKITALYGLVGYNDFSTFHRNFKSVTGISPAEYKKRI